MYSDEWLREALETVEINSINTPVRKMPEGNIVIGPLGREHISVRKLYILLVELQRELNLLSKMLEVQLKREIMAGRALLECVCCDCKTCLLRNTIHCFIQQLLIVESHFLSDLDFIFSDKVALLRASKVINVSAGWVVSVSFGPLMLVEGASGQTQKALIPSLS